MKVVALDYGERHVGIAMTDDEGALALRHRTIDTRSEDALGVVGEIVRDERVQLVLVGVPRNLDGEETQQSQQIRQFTSELERYFSNLRGLTSKVSIEMIDETLTSVEAEENLQREGVPVSGVHAESARIMLDDYLRTSQTFEVRPPRFEVGRI